MNFNISKMFYRFVRFLLEAKPPRVTLRCSRLQGKGGTILVETLSFGPASEPSLRPAPLQASPV